MKRFMAVALAGIIFAAVAAAQDQTLLKEFTRTGYISGMKLSFVLLTDKTIDMFFSGASKDVIKEKTTTGTTFFILGTTDRKIKLNTKLVVEQDGEKFTGSIMNIKNFQDGELAKGEKVNAILQLDKKLNLRGSFMIRGSDGIVDFKLTDFALMNVSE